ncbi:universal stress protein, partial [Streptomyces beihaiensis]
GIPQLGGIPLPHDMGEAARTWARTMLTEAAGEAGRRHPGLTVETDDLPGEPVQALLDEAGQAGLLVLGSRGLGPLTGSVVGSVAHAVVARSTAPVVLVPAGERGASEHVPDAVGRESESAAYRDVVLGLDPAHADAAVLDFAFDEAARRRSGLHVVHGWSLPPYYARFSGALDPELDAQLAARARARLNDVLESWRDRYPGVTVREHAVIGSAGPLLVEASHDASLIVVGRGGGHPGQVGPVVQAVLHHAVAPVAVVPHG